MILKLLSVVVMAGFIAYAANQGYSGTPVDQTAACLCCGVAAVLLDPAERQMTVRSLASAYSPWGC